MGHLTYIANKLLEASNGSSQVLQYLDACEPWQVYVEGTLKQRNVVENVMQWACGRPNAAELTDISGEVEEAAAQQLMELQPEPAADDLPNFFRSKASSESPDADGPVYRDASLAFESLQLAPPQLGSQAGDAGKEAPQAAENADRSASPPGASGTLGSGGQDSTDRAAADSLEGTESSASAPWDGAAGSHQSLAPTGELLLVDVDSAGAPTATEPASSSPPALISVTEAGGASGVSAGPSGSPSEAEPSSGAPGDAEAVAKADEGEGDSLGGDSQDVWKPTWPAEEEAAAQAPPTAPIAVPSRRADISTNSSSPEDTAAAAVGFAVPADAVAAGLAETEGAAASFAAAGYARRGSRLAAADGDRVGLATGGLTAALAEEKLSEAGGSISDDDAESASVQLPCTAPPEAEGEPDTEPCQSGAEPASADK